RAGEWGSSFVCYLGKPGVSEEGGWNEQRHAQRISAPHPGGDLRSDTRWVSYDQPCDRESRRNVLDGRISWRRDHERRSRSTRSEQADRIREERPRALRGTAYVPVVGLLVLGFECHSARMAAADLLGAAYPSGLVIEANSLAQAARLGRKRRLGTS